MVVFGDLTEHSNSLLAKGFVHDKPWRLDLNNKIKNPSFVNSASLNQDGKITISQSTTIKIPSAGASLKCVVGLDGNVSLEGSHTLTLAPQFTITGKAGHKLNGPRDQWTTDVTGDLQRDPFHIRLNGSPLTRNWKLSACAQTKLAQLRCNSPDTVAFGYEVSGNSASLESLQNSLGVSITRPINDHLIYGALKLTNHNKSPFGKVSLTVGGKSPASVGSEMGGEAVYIIPEERAEMAIGAKWFITSDKKTMLKAKVDHEGKVAAAVNHKVNENFGITMGMQFDMARKAVASPKSQGSAGLFGVALNLTA